MAKNLDELTRRASLVRMTPAQQEQQRRSFAYGNAGIENDRITREMVDRQAEKLKESNE